MKLEHHEDLENGQLVYTVRLNRSEIMKLPMPFLMSLSVPKEQETIGTILATLTQLYYGIKEYEEKQQQHAQNDLANDGTEREDPEEKVERDPTN